MGPDMRLQRVVASDQGLVEDPTRNEVGDCESRYFQDPEYTLRPERLINLNSDEEFIFTCRGRY